MMARKREDQNRDHFDLLPFIAILMCTLGCLLLVTMSMAALSIGPAAGEGWIPVRDHTKTLKIPILVEWDGTTATFHLEGRKVPLQWSGPSGIRIGGQWLALKTDENEDSEEFRKILDDLEARRETHYALFAVRPSGFSSFNRFAYEFRSRSITVGYEPLAQERPVRLVKSEVQP